jgi:hypothetical protein
MDPPVRPVDYTNIGFTALRDAMLGLARESVPEWTDLSENDLGVLLVELFAYAADITLYYQTRIAQNLLPATSDEPEALTQLLRLIGYELRPPGAATVNLRVAFEATEPTPIAIPARTQFTVAVPTGEELTFETERAIRIENTQLSTPDSRNLRSYFPVSVVQGESIADEAVGVSDGSPSQRYTLRQPGVVAGSIEVRVTEPGGEALWREVETLAFSTPADRHFVVLRDAAGAATILFGDDTNGMAPPPSSPTAEVKITATYRVTDGPAGNVPAATAFRSALSNIREATNPQAAAGATPGEPFDRARRLAPRLFRTQERAVTLGDYTDLAHQVAGVGKARATAVGWNEVVLNVAPSGQVAEPSELLRRDLLAFFERRRMATTSLTVAGPDPADIYLRADVQAQPYYLRSDVRAAVERAVAGYLAFEAVDFGQPVYLSRVYDTIQSLPQVASLNITQFSRERTGAIAADGVILLGPSELPRPGYRDNPPAGVAPTPIVIALQGGVVDEPEVTP